MFTGLVEGIGEVRAVRVRFGVRELRIRSPFPREDLGAGSSISIHGVCLTLVGSAAPGGTFCVQVVSETLRRSNLGRLRAGDRVHLERSLRAGARLGGHIVQGHVDGLGRIRRSGHRAGEWVMDIGHQRAIARYIVEKGSICVDGVSLTVARKGRDWFRVHIIPATAAATLFARYRPGRLVNLEVDPIAKYVESVLAMAPGTQEGGAARQPIPRAGQAGRQGIEPGVDA